MTYSVTYKFDAMKKEFKNLSIEEFVRVICEAPKIYEFEVKDLSEKGIKGIEQDYIKGDYWALHSCFLNLLISDDGNTRSFASGVINELESNVFDYTLEYSYIDIYDYLECKTKGFDKERCRILLKDLDYYKFIVKEELEKDDEACEYQFFDYSRAINILLDKIEVSNDEALQQEKQSPTLPNELDTPKARIVFKKAIEKGYMTPKGNRYQWHQSNVLLAYLCGKLYSGDFIHKSKHLKDEYKKGELPFPEKSINGLFYDRTDKALANIKESRNGLSSSPKGYTLIDELFKEASN